jgi:hypothetical protein
MDGVSGLFQRQSLRNANLTGPGRIPENPEFILKKVLMTPLPGLFHLHSVLLHNLSTSTAPPPLPGPKTSPKAFSKNRRRREKWQGRVRRFISENLPVPFHGGQAAEVRNGQSEQSPPSFCSTPRGFPGLRP